MAKRAKILVDAQHNVENFRPYKIAFKDRKDVMLNTLKGLKLAIKREGEWNGWFDEYGDLEGTTFKTVGKQIDEALSSVREKEYLIVNGFERNSKDDVVQVQNRGLVVWMEKDGKDLNVGFGMAYADKGQVSINDTDKYENKWVNLC